MSICINPTIAIIDSGIGGVAVLKQIMEKYQSGNYLYFADNLFMPYGNKTKLWLKKRIDNIIGILREKYKVDYIIIACNTASSALDEKQYGGVKTMEFNKEHTYFATLSTKNNMPSLKVIADNTLARQIEKNIFNDKMITETIKKHIKQHKLYKNDELVLGCTHYELVKDIFTKYCPKTKIIANSEFLIEKLNFPIKAGEINLVILSSKEDEVLKNKIYKLLRS